MSSQGERHRRSRFTIELTEGAFRVSCGPKCLTVFPAARLPEMAAPADFLIRLDEILNWDAPHEDCEVEADDLRKIASEIVAECERRGLTVAFV